MQEAPLPRSACRYLIVQILVVRHQHAFLGSFFALAFESLAGARIIVNGAWDVATGGASDGVGCAFSLLLSAFDDFLDIVAV